MSPAASLRVRILGIVFAVAVVPMALLGLWLNQSAARSARQLVQARLDAALEDAASSIGSAWLGRRSQLLDFAETPEVQGLFEDDGATASGVSDRFGELPSDVLGARVVDLEGQEPWLGTRRQDDAAGPNVALAIALPVYGPGLGPEVGVLEVDLLAEALMPSEGFAPTVAGMVFGLMESATGRLLRPLPFDLELLGTSTFRWAGDEWLTERRTLEDPPVTLVAAAPLSPFTGPFERAARRGTWLLLIVAVVGFTLVAVLTSRMTRALRHLSAAADAVSHGDLEQRVDVRSDDEVGRVARAFNTMTESLRQTLQELAKRESLAAVGEFAASLAHEVRNPLTAIRVDLQRVQEGLDRDSLLWEPQDRALREIARLDDTVASTLRKAKRGDASPNAIDVRDAIHAACEAVAPVFDTRGATLHCELPDEAVLVRGDLGQLEQVFINVLQNAAQALDGQGSARIHVDRGEDRLVTVHVRDEGTGIPAGAMKRVFEPMFTTRAEGTGLGLTIARRIVATHGGTVTLESELGAGTTVSIQLPAGEGTE